MPPRCIFVQDYKSSAGPQINPIDVNFHLQKDLEIFEKNSTDKIRIKIEKERKVSHCLWPIRVDTSFSCIFRFTL